MCDTESVDILSKAINENDLPSGTELPLFWGTIQKREEEYKKEGVILMTRSPLLFIV